ncbi:MAG TPA: gliding motility-associated C-terminal domain-containing protein, partial [Saprospiraceae bacterium]|nr:gliding motility-associated C-terminal domain-containing protein [Saprospiraceae bacterium]
MSTVLSTLLSLLLSVPALAQHTFRKTYGAAGRDLARSVLPLADGGYWVAGSTRAVAGTHDDALLMRLDAYGDIVWQGRYGGSGDDLFTDCCMANDGGLLCLGQTRSYGAGGLDVWLLKLDEQGQVLWSRTYGKSTDDQATYLLPLPPDAYALWCNGSPNNATQFDAWGLKLDNLGQPDWTVAYSDGADNLMASRRAATDSTAWAGGIQLSTGGFFDGLLAEISLSDGSVRRAYTYGNGALYYIFPSQGGSLIAVDGSMSASGERWAWALQINPADGQVLWSNRYGLPGRPYRGRAASASALSGFLLALYDPSSPSSHPASDAVLARVDAAGQVLWAYDYGGPGSDRWMDVRACPDGGWVACGAYDMQDAAMQDILVLKTDASGYAGGCCAQPVPLLREPHAALPTPRQVPAYAWASPLSAAVATGPASAASQVPLCTGHLALDIVREDASCVEGGSIEVRATGCDSCVYEFQGLLSQANIFSALKPGDYHIRVLSTGSGCEVDTTVSVGLLEAGSFVEMPNAFTPNGDGLNERFRPAVAPLCPLLVNHLRIFDRWGNQVFEQRDFSSDDLDAGWDGKHAGHSSPADVY